jgi:hypothetical protein
MVKELRGTRYLKDPDFGRFIVEKLPYLDLAETLEFYGFVDQHGTDADKALLNCNDRFYLLSVSCGRPDMWIPWVFERCREVEADPDGYLDLWARMHYKSTICTFGGIIQEVLVNPEITCAIISGTDKIARPFLIQIQEEFERNEDLKRQHSDVLWANPRSEAPQWSRYGGIVVRRRGNQKEATVEAFGLIDGMRTGKHYDLLNFDDLINETMVDNPDVVKKVTQRWELSDNLGVLGFTKKRMQGTRYSFADTYGIIIDRAIIKVRVYPATIDGTLTGEPVLLTKEKWKDAKLQQRSTVNAQMLLNPIAGNEATFSMLALQHYDVIPTVMNVYIMCDPSKGKTKRSDRTAILVIGIDVGGNKYLLDGYCHRMKLSRRYDLLCQLREKWANHPGVQHVRVGYEQYCMQVDLEVIEEYQERDNDQFKIEELGTPSDGTYSKRDRISRMEPDFNRGIFYLPAVVYHPDFGGGPSNSALWDVWTEEDSQRMILLENPNNPAVGTVVYRPMGQEGYTKAQRVCAVTFQKSRIVVPIKRLNEDGDIYDLTRCFIEEYRLHPFAPHDDILDCASRHHDLDPTKPVPFESMNAEPRTYKDS